MAKQKKHDAGSDSIVRKPGNKLGEFKEFFDQSIVELKKVTWPTRKEAMTTSAAVLFLVLLMSLFLGLVDLGLTKIIEVILQ